MSSEQNKAIVRRAFEEPWKGNLDVVDELISSDYVGHDPASPEPLRGPQGVKEFISTYLAPSLTRGSRSSSNSRKASSPPAGLDAGRTRES